MDKMPDEAIVLLELTFSWGQVWGLGRQQTNKRSFSVATCKLQVPLVTPVIFIATGQRSCTAVLLKFSKHMSHLGVLLTCRF